MLHIQVSAQQLKYFQGKPFHLFFLFLKILEDTARYAGLFLAPAEGFGLRPNVFFGLWAKKINCYAFLANFRQFWFPVVTLVTLKRKQKVQKII